MNIIKEIFLTKDIKEISKNKSKKELQNYTLDLFSKSKPYLKSEYETINNFVIDCYKFALKNMDNVEEIHIMSNLLTGITENIKIDFNAFIKDLKNEENKENEIFLKYFIKYLIEILNNNSVVIEDNKDLTKEYVSYHLSLLTYFVKATKNINHKEINIVKFSDDYMSLVLKHAKFE